MLKTAGEKFHTPFFHFIKKKKDINIHTCSHFGDVGGIN
jgi:hypothetical protein